MLCGDEPKIFKFLNLDFFYIFFVIMFIISFINYRNYLDLGYFILITINYIKLKLIKKNS